ncbi:MAG: hypothetical protein AMJ75_04295 [Phycisphaerae bacterium SM1_79]|nr:MAG: hypothetical protein AMJ75_04295 [Phycisphaerae bacterium SM1_79]
MDDMRIASHRLPRVKVMANRVELVQSYCEEKNVLHLGCVGSLESFDKGYSLHQKISEVAARVIGVDADEQAIEYLRPKGIQDLVCADVQAPGALKIPEIKEPVDVVVAGELLEHLPNPGLCLENIAGVMDRQSILLVTVPNAFSLRNFFLVLLRNRERIRADHNYYFSYTTIKRLLTSSGFMIVNILACSDLQIARNRVRRIAKRIFNKTALRYSPFTAEAIIVIAKPV